MKNFKKVLLFLLVAVFAFSAVACGGGSGDDKPTTKSLDAPVVELSGSIISWKSVDHAEKYVVYKGDFTLATVTSLSYDLSQSITTEGIYQICVMATANGYDNSAKSNVVTYVVGQAEPETLTAPVISLNGSVVSWGAVANATSYKVFDGNNELETLTTTSLDLSGLGLATGGHTISVKALATGFTTSAASNSITYTVSGPILPGKLTAPVASLTGTILSWGVVENAETYKVYEGSDVLATLTETSVDLATLTLEVGTHTIFVKAFGTGYASSDSSANITFVVEPKVLTEDDVRALATDDISIPTDLYGALVLPSEHQTEELLTYVWSSNNDCISIENNVATFSLITEDKAVTLTCVATYQQGETPVVVTLTYEVTSHAITEMTVEQFRQNPPAVNGSLVKLSGTIVSFGRNQSLDTRCIFLAYNGEAMQIDFYSTEHLQYVSGTLSYSDTEFTSLKVGDNVVISGSYRDGSSDRPTIEKITAVEVKSSGNAVDYGKEKAFVLDSYESYEAVGNDLNGYSGKLVKIVNPYLCGSSSKGGTAGNYVRFSYAEGCCSVPIGSYGKIFSFLIAAQNENLGSQYWADALEIPVIDQEVLYEGLTIYAYVSFIGDSVTQFIIPGRDAIEYTDINYLANLEFAATMEATVESGETLVLPARIERFDSDITWADPSGIINVATGLATASSTTVVPLEATFTVEGVQKTAIFNVTVTAMSKQTISEVLASATDGTPVYVSGTVIAFSSDGNSKEEVKGITLMDGNGAILYVDAIGSLYGKTYPNYVDADGTMIEVGQVVEVIGLYKAGSRATIALNDSSFAGEVHVVSGTPAQFVPEKFVVITENEEFINAFTNAESLYGKVIKIVGTEENPLFAGGSSSTAPMNVKLYMNQGATKAADVKPDGTHTVALKVDVNTPNLFENWHMPYFGLPETAVINNTNYPVYGSLYIVLNNITSSYWQCSIVNVEGMTAFGAKALEQVETGIPSETAPGNVTLPTTVQITPSLSSAVTWSSESSLVSISGTSCTFGTPSENTTVILVGTFTVDGHEYKLEVEVTILVSAKVYTNISELAAGTVGETYSVQGVVIGLTKTTEAACELLVKDAFTNDIIGVSGMGNYSSGYTLNGLVVGDTIQFEGVLSKSSETNINGDYGRLYLAYSGSADLAQLKATITGAVTTIDKTQALEITTQDQLRDLFIGESGLTDSYAYKVLHLVGAYGINYTSSTSPRDTYIRIFFDSAISAVADQKLGAAFEIGNSGGGISPSISTMISAECLGISVSELNTLIGNNGSKDWSAPAELNNLYVIVGGGTKYYFHLTVVE